MKFRKMISMVLICSLLLTMVLPINGSAEEVTEGLSAEETAVDDTAEELTAEAGNTNNALTPVITGENVVASPGGTIDMHINLKNNPGVIGAVLKVTYDEGLELIDSKCGEAFADLSMTKPGTYTSPCVFMWDQIEVSSDEIKDGDILTLTFKTSEEAASGDEYEVKLSYADGDIINSELEAVSADIINGKVTIGSNYIPGDANGDEKVNATDVILARRFIAGGYSISVNEDAIDVNADSKINATDVILMRRFIAGGYKDASGAPLTLVRGNASKDKCEHAMTATAYKAPTCTEAGNIAYWHCEKCNKYYRDEQGTNEVSSDNLVIAANGHTPVVDPAVEPTATSKGLTEGSHCSVCGTVLVKQEEISSDYYSIKYNIANGDTYLAKLGINNPNPASVQEGATVYLEDLEVDGYQFLGWYDGAGTNAEQVKKIVNADHSISLYAHWSKIEYTIQFKSDLVPEDSITYTTKEGKILPTPTLDGYSFVGWTDFDGNIYTRIVPGTKGDITLYANWISDRNKAWAKKKYGDPIVYDDENVILFAYEIGEVRDVPVYEIENFGKINKDGVSQTVTKKYSVTTSEQLMEAYTKTIENATTKSSNWTLSSGWSDETQVSEEWCKQNNVTKEEAESIGKSETGCWHVSNSSGGSKSNTTIASTDTHDLTTTTNNTKSWSDDYGQTTSHGDIVTHKEKENVEVSVGAEYHAEAEVDAGVAKAKAGYSVSVDASSSKETEDSVTTQGDDTTTMSGKVFDDANATNTGTVETKASNSESSSTWNSESGFSNSVTTSSNKTISTAVSEMISNKTGYGRNYIQTGSESNSQGLTSSSSEENSYASSVTYSTVKSEEVEMTYTTTNTKTGYHRWVMAGTAHVYGVVGYDVVTNSYFTYTYSVMDDEMHRFEDYSYTSSSFDDNQNGVIPFEVPYDIHEYVKSRMFASDGLEIDADGNVTNYTGTDTYVVIPDYVVMDNGDGSKKSIKITGLSETAFKGNENICGIKLSRFIDSIPNDAFRGCKNLCKIDAYVTSVGNNAFRDCPLLTEWNLSNIVSSLGSNAFKGAEKLRIKAANTSVLKNALNSGVKDIVAGVDKLSDTLDNCKLTVPTGTESVAINGYGKTFNNLSIESSANKTIINRLNIISNSAIPLKSTSAEINLNQSKLINSGICAIFTANDLTLDLYGASSMESSCGKTLFCKDTDVIRTKTGLKTALTLTGDLVTCGTINDPNKFISFTEEVNIPAQYKTQYKYDRFYGRNSSGAYRCYPWKTGVCTTYEATNWLDNPLPQDGAFDDEGTPKYARGYNTDGRYVGGNNGSRWDLYWYNQQTQQVEISPEHMGGGKIMEVDEDTFEAMMNSYKLVFNANGGECATASKQIDNPAMSIGELPTPTRSGYVFDGWYRGDTKVTSDSVFSAGTDIELLAAWRKISDWVLESSMPAGATLLDEKWSYDKITKITSSSSSVSGYTLYDSSYVWSDYGAWSGWTNDYVGSSESRNVETRDIAATYKTQYRYERFYGKNSSGSYRCYPWKSGVCTTYEATNWLDTPLPTDGTFDNGAPKYARGYNTNGEYVGGVGSGNRWDIYWYSQSTQDVQVTPAYTQYRYRDRQKIWTYYLKKTEHLESTTKVNAGNGIENVKRWVKYY